MKKQDYPKEGRCYIFEETDELGEIYYRIGQSDNLKNRMKTHNSSSSHNKIIIFNGALKKSFLYLYLYKVDLKHFS